MQLILDPRQDAAHGEWLRHVPGAYEWWYFDAISDDHLWTIACIWFLGNPFSPYYRLAAQGVNADPYAHNALFFALHCQGTLHAYHFTRFPQADVCADEMRPATLCFGPNALTYDGAEYRLQLFDENANRRRLRADLRFQSPPLLPTQETMTAAKDSGHFWLPAAPSCPMSAAITLCEPRNSSAEQIPFRGLGYHDHNWGQLPFAADVRDWYWARTSLPKGRAIILYGVASQQAHASSGHLLLFDQGRLVKHDPHAEIRKSRMRVNAFGTRYATRLEASGAGMAATFLLRTRLDSSPFYIRALCHATVTQGAAMEQGLGMAEYFRPRLLGTPLAASAMKARIVEA